jgi:nucleoside-triphosphatase
MFPASEKILLTGLPGCGKTTAVIKIVEALEGISAAGFYTEEIRQNQTRTGFRWRRIDGPEGILAGIDIKSRFRVGRYGVDVAGFEKSVVPVLDSEQADAELFVIDEIGKMECFSIRFIDAVRQLFATDKSVLAAVAKKGGGFIDEVKTFAGVKIFTLTEQNRDKTVAEIIALLKGA